MNKREKRAIEVQIQLYETCSSRTIWRHYDDIITDYGTDIRIHQS